MTKIDDLINEYGEKKKIPYSRLLETREWHYKRSLIIQRDSDKCSSCHNKTTEYLLGNHIWWFEYIKNIKQPNDKFWEKLDYYEKLLGDKFVGISATDDDYEYVPEEMDTVVVVDKQYYLQVHHKHYVEGKLPWEYPNEYLITLCNWCHFELHQKQVIPVFIEIKGKLFEKKITPCLRCHGAGIFPQYKHIQDGICFRCDGAKFDEYIIPK